MIVVKIKIVLMTKMNIIKVKILKLKYQLKLVKVMMKESKAKMIEIYK